jgi:hypothetical protein
MANGYIFEREKIQHGTRLKLLRQRDGVPSGTLARVDTIREENREQREALACTGMITAKRTDTACCSRKVT